MNYSTPLLYAGVYLDLGEPETYHYFDPMAQTAIFFKNESGTVSVATSFGDAESYAVGCVFEAHADQTGRSMGRLTVVGRKQCHHLSEGIIPSAGVRHYVFK